MSAGGQGRGWEGAGDGEVDREGLGDGENVYGVGKVGSEMGTDDGIGLGLKMEG